MCVCLQGLKIKIKINKKALWQLIQNAVVKNRDRKAQNNNHLVCQDKTHGAHAFVCQKAYQKRHFCLNVSLTTEYVYVKYGLANLPNGFWDRNKLDPEVVKFFMFSISHFNQTHSLRWSFIIRIISYFADLNCSSQLSKFQFVQFTSLFICSASKWMQHSSHVPEYVQSTIKHIPFQTVTANYSNTFCLMISNIVVVHSNIEL